MSAAMDKALMAMSLEEEDEPFDLPDLPDYCSHDTNKLSLIGRILNPMYQKMSSLILDMPRKWQKLGKVRGIALSKERFQFIFDHKHDLLDVQEKGVHSYKEWTIVVERWTEFPGPEFLQFIPIWVQVSNIPTNHYTKKAIWALGDLAAPVTEVAFDPLKPQNREFVRVKVRFDVSKPLKKEKVINLLRGGTTKIFFHYERIQKRCYTCQRLSHDKDHCPIEVMKRQAMSDARRAGNSIPKPRPTRLIKETDPLYGVLEESQVGINPNSGRPKIAAEVLEGMRQYLLAAEGEERRAREERVRRSVGEAEKDLFTQKVALSLEPIPTITKDLDKGKGHIFGYDATAVVVPPSDKSPQGSKLMASAIPAGTIVVRLEKPVWERLGARSSEATLSYASSKEDSTGFSQGFYEAGSSGINPKKKYIRKRPGKSKRKQKRGGDT
ncbi:uncharacterized protein LOC108845310 [Raphanus sativus]|uniref:Uncharacterized protein LOC108845310 n=1 Tax=Raphanus sativus TaxID=3726 RepID=A0A6J0MNH5_RAPSA|nr:uncharacterized protein LOC108845310 [Raphanus sativus]